MSVQTQYDKNMQPAINGTVAWDFGTADITSAVAEAVVPFGTGVVKGAAAGAVIVGNANIKGFAVRSLINQNSVNTGVNAFAATESAAIMREGYINLTNKSAATGLAEDEDVFLNAAGELVAAGDAGAAKIVGCNIERGGAAGEICLVRVQINKA